jgi:hypothetical protein
MRSQRDGKRRRAGFTFLEVQVAFILLGIGLAGLGPLVVMQIRLSKKIENGFNPQTAYFRSGTTSYLVPAADPWERKLGVSATILTTTPGAWGTTTTTPPAPSYDVTIVGPVEKALGSESVTVHVSLTKRPEGSP